LQWCRNLDTSECRSEIPGKFWNVVLEKDGEHLDRSCEKKGKVLHRVKERRNVLRTIKRRNAKSIGHILRTNCLLSHVIERKIEGMIEVRGRRGRIRKRILVYFRETRGYCKFKEETLDRTLWRTRFGRGYGPVVSQTTE